jgi:hypothetical protein
VLRSSFVSIVQGLKQISRGLALKAGDQKQVGGEFLFEPEDVRSPIASPGSEKQLGALNSAANGQHVAENSSTTRATHGGSEESEEGGPYEEKRVTWCHRMRSTRDHAEMPELMEVLGLDGHGKPADDQKRWSKALESRKGTGLSLAAQMKASNGGVVEDTAENDKQTLSADGPSTVAAN